jgi:tRNA 2-thiouridine synthesizing protein C
LNPIAILNTQSPYANALAQESLDMAMAASSFDQAVWLFFMDDGVLQLVDGQNPKGIGRKAFTKGIAALPLYDIDRIYVCANSLKERGLDTPSFPTDITLVSPTELQQKLTECQHVVRF